jgi:quercetin dioxygenase-like cupin family protein
VTRREPLWFLGTLVVMLIDGSDTGGRFSLFEQHVRRGTAPPLHAHAEDETFYVLEGELAYWMHDREQTARAGDAFTALSGTPHSWLARSETARLLVVSTPAGIENFVRDGSTPADAPVIPPPDAPRPTLEQLDALAAKHGVEIFGPPPTG